MTAAKRDLYIEQGATYRDLQFTWYQGDDPLNPGPPVNLTGANARMQIRKTLTSLAMVTAVSTGVAPRITLGGVLGTVAVVLTDEDTMLLVSKAAVYDFEIEDSTGVVHRLLQGKVTIDPNVTREDP
jgi:hypothetical protein